MSIFEEILLDTIVLQEKLMVACQHRYHWAGPGGVLLFIFFCSVSVSPDIDAQEFEKGLPLERYIRSVGIYLEPNSEHQSVLAFFIRFINFGCVTCQNDFFDFADSLEQRMKQHGHRTVVVLFVRDSRDKEVQERLMRGWLKSNRLFFPMLVVPREVFDSYNVDYTSAILIGAGSSIEVMEQFPIDLQMKEAFLTQLFKVR